MTEHIEVASEAPGLSRRSLIKRISAGAALAWTAPILLTVNSAAAASPVCTGETCLQSCFNFIELCGDPECYCDTDLEGNCHCFNYNSFCTEYITGCSSSAECPSGHYCVADTCCQTTICAPDCAVEVVKATGAVAGGTKPTGRS